MPASSLETATPVRSGEFDASPPGAVKDLPFAANAAPANASAATPTTASARPVDPAIAASVAENPPDVIAPNPSLARRRRRLARAPRIPRAAEEFPPRRRPPRERAARLLELSAPAVAVGAAARGGRGLGLARHADLPPRALRRLPGGPRVRRRPARAARPAAGARPGVRLRRGQGAR